MWSKFKSLGWIVGLGTALSALLLVLHGTRAATRHNNAKRKEDKAIELQNTGISKNLKKARILLESAQKDKYIASAAKKKMRTQLEKIGKANEDIDDIVNRHNSKRVRKSGAKKPS